MRLGLRYPKACLSFLLLASLPLRAELIAERLDQTNLEQRARGSDAIAGVGDWLLSNGKLCAAVSAVDHETGLSDTGGWLVDLGHCGRADDEFSYTHMLPGMQRENMLPAVDIQARVGADSASITVRRANAQLEATISYRLSREPLGRLFVVSEWRRKAAGKDLALVGQLWLHPQRALTPFSIDTRDRSRSPGFSYPSFEREQKMSALNAMHSSDLTVLVGDSGAAPGISYGIHSELSVLVDSDGVERPVEQFTLIEDDYSNQLWLTRPLWFGGGDKPGRLQLLQSLFMDLEPGETLRIEQSIIVGARADVASVTDRIYQGGTLRGSLDTPLARIEVVDDSGYPVTQIRPSLDGSFRARLPAGLQRCELRVRTPWGEERQIAVETEDRDYQLGMIETAAPATVYLPRGFPLRLVFKGRDGTPDPALGDDLLGYRVGSEARPGLAQRNDVSLAGLAADPHRIALPPGSYRVYATRGPEFTVESQDFEVEAGGSVALDLPPLRRAVDREGWVGTDFHVHSGFSFDATLSAAQRLRSFVAQGADVLVSTEHDVVVDLGEIAAQLRLNDRLTVVAGAELTGMARAGDAPRTIGHVNVYPLAPDPGAFAGGLPPHEGVRLRELMARLREAENPPLIQLNHPRQLDGHDADIAFFDHLSVGERFNPGLPLNNVQNRSLVETDPVSGLRDIDFDVLELANGGNLAQYQLVRADWLALLLQGEIRAAVASSDSHRLAAPVAMPRSYVAYDRPLRHPVDTAELFQAVRAGRVMGSSGPVPRVELLGPDGERAGVGETLVGKTFTLKLSADAAPWVGVDQVWVFLNGAVLKGTAIEPGETLEMPIEVSQDSFLLVEFFGEAGEIYRALAPGHRPMAFTNPIWIDADGDGRWSAPGLGKRSMAISDPHSLPSVAPE